MEMEAARHRGNLNRRGHYLLHLKPLYNTIKGVPGGKRDVPSGPKT